MPSNISEGVERLTKPEFRQFAGYAKGSAGELRTQLMIGSDLGYISSSDAAALITECREISRMLFGLIKSLGDSSSPST